MRLPLITKPICSNRSISLASWPPPPRVNAAFPEHPDSGSLKSATDRDRQERENTSRASGQFLPSQKNLLEDLNVAMAFLLRMTDLTSGKGIFVGLREIRSLFWDVYVFWGVGGFRRGIGIGWRNRVLI